MRILIAFLTLAISSHALAEGRPLIWRAGIATARITPAEPMWMAGYASRAKPAAATLRDIWAKVVVLEESQRGKRVVLIALDLLGIDRETSNAIRDTLHDKYGLDRADIAICCTHTHSGPVIGANLRVAYSMEDGETEKIRKYTATLEQTVIALVGKAAEDLGSATLRYRVGHATFAVNRRNNKEAEVVKQVADAPVKTLDWRKKLVGPVDHDLPVLAIYKDGKPAAIVFGYACHATTLSGYEWSADWPGYACEEIQKDFPGATAFFVAGCGGDQNPLPRKTVELARQYGREAADGVAKALLLEPEGRNLAPTLRTTYREIDLGFGDLPSREQLEVQMLSKDPKDRYQARRASLLLERMARDGKLPQSYSYPIQTWRLGGGPTLVFLGGEVVVDYALRLKKELPGDVWPIAYANDVMAYIPSRRVLEEGGYEGGGAMVYYGLPATWGTGVEEAIVGEVKRQAR